MYLVIALVCSTVNEAISTAFGMRARFLQLGLAGWDEVEREARSPRHLFLVATHEDLDDPAASVALNLRHDATMGRTYRLIMLGAALGSAGVLVVAAAGKNYPGVLPKPLFATPGAAAYCYIDAKNLDDYSAELFCWTPNDGWAAWIDWRGRRAETGYFNRPPKIVHGLGVLRGYKPRARVLRFGQALRIRCGEVEDFSTCPSHEGVIAFTCISRPTGLTCRNAAGHGYWIGRYRGHRLF